MNRKILVGMLLLGALVIFALGTFYIENWQFYLREGYQLRADFSTVQSLDEGDLVRMAGVTVGKVAEVSIDTRSETEFPVKTILWIEKDVKIRADDEAQIRLSTLFGGNFVAIARGDPSAPVLGRSERIRKTSVAPSVPEIIEESKATLSEAREALENIRKISEKVERGEGTLGKLVTQDEAYDDLKGVMSEAREAFARVQKVADSVEHGEGLLPRLLTDNELAADAQEAIASARDSMVDLRAITKDMRAGKGLAGKLLTDEALGEDVKEAFSRLKEIGEEASKGKGVLAKLLSDEKLATDLDQISSDAKAVFANLKGVTQDMDKGTLGKLLASDEAYNRLMETLDELKKSTSAIAEGKGSLGKLVQSETLYEKIVGTIESLQRVIEDYREQSPLITFAGAIFGAF